MFKIIETIGAKTPKALAYFIIVVGFAAVTARILLPLSKLDTDFFSDHLTAFSGRPASIQNVRYSWTGWAPTLTAQKLNILDKPNGTTLIHFPIVRIEVSPIQSLINRELTAEKITFEKLNISLIRDEVGKISVRGMPPPKFPIFTWLLSQKVFSLIDVTLQFEDKMTQQNILLTNLTAISAHNKGHEIFGSAQLPKELGQHFEFSMESDSTIAKGVENIDMLVKAENLNLRNVLTILNQPLDLDEVPIADFSGKGVWEDSTLKTFDFAFRGPSSAIKSENPIAIEGAVSSTGSTWKLDIRHLSVPHISSLKMQNAINLVWKQDPLLDKEIKFSAKQFDIAIAMYLARLSAAVPLEAQKLLETVSPRGSMENIIGHYYPDGTDSDFAISLGVKNLSTRRTDKYPALNGFSGVAKISQIEGELILLKTDFYLDEHHNLDSPLEFNSIEGSLNWEKNGKGNWSISVPSISGKLNNSAFHMSGRYKNLLSNEAYLDVGVSLPKIDTQSLSSLLPVNILSRKGETWMRNLFHKGQLTEGMIAFRGPTQNFPFRNSEGTLVADFKVSKSTLEYARLWPLAREVNGHIALREDNLYFIINEGTIGEASISNANVNSKQLFNKEKFVSISGRATAPGTFPSELVLASPLIKTKAKQITQFILEDDITLHLDMTVPLFSGGEKDISGRATFDKNTLSLARTDIKLAEVSGSLFLKNTQWWTNKLTAILDATEIHLNAKSGKNTEPYAAEVYIQGNSTIEKLIFRLEKHSPGFAKWLTEKNFTSYIKGNLDWDTTITMPKKAHDNNKEKFNGQFKFSSNLVGVKSTLPMPMKKSAPNEKEFSVDLKIEDGKLKVGFIDFFENGDVPTFETAKHTTLHKGILFRGSFHHIEIDAWIKFFKGDISTNEDTEKIPLLFDIRTRAANLFRHDFSDMRIKGLQIKEGWNIKVEGIDASGNIILPSLRNSNVLDIKLQHLRLIKKTSLTEAVPQASSDLEPNDFPSLAIDINDFMYHGIELGKTKVAASKNENELVFNTLTSETEDALVDASGRWTTKKGSQTSAFEITANGKSASKFLRQFGYQGKNIKGGEIGFSAKVNWAGPPSSLKIKNLNGSMQVALTDGRFKNVDPGSGRIFGLLSLQSLPRRLSLDFKDLFKKGFAFDSISGDFQIIKGYAHTDNLVTEGPSAKITIRGKTGLASHDYDQIATVTPALSGSIPVASALFGPVGIGAGAVYYIGGKMFKSIPKQIDKFLTQDYSITGTWDVPIIKKIKKSK